MRKLPPLYTLSHILVMITLITFLITFLFILLLDTLESLYFREIKSAGDGT